MTYAKETVKVYKSAVGKKTPSWDKALDFRPLKGYAKVVQYEDWEKMDKWKHDGMWRSHSVGPGCGNWSEVQQVWSTNDRSVLMSWGALKYFRDGRVCDFKSKWKGGGSEQYHATKRACQAMTVFDTKVHYSQQVRDAVADIIQILNWCVAGLSDVV